jgi:hypothetical protein
MALLNNSTSAIYLNITSGKIAQRIDHKSDTSKERTLKDGRVIDEELYDNVSGFITAIKIKDNQYGRQLSIGIENNGKQAVLQMPFSSGYAISFLKALPNADLKQEVTLIPKSEEKDGKTKTVMFISQGGKGVKWAFTKDNPNGLPQMEKIKVKGKETWDDSKQLEFFERYITGLAINQDQAVTEDEAPF